LCTHGTNRKILRTGFWNASRLVPHTNTPRTPRLEPPFLLWRSSSVCLPALYSPFPRAPSLSPFLPFYSLPFFFFRTLSAPFRSFSAGCYDNLSVYAEVLFRLPSTCRIFDSPSLRNREFELSRRNPSFLLQPPVAFEVLLPLLRFSFSLPGSLNLRYELVQRSAARYSGMNSKWKLSPPGCWFFPSSSPVSSGSSSPSPTDPHHV